MTADNHYCCWSWASAHTNARNLTDTCEAQTVGSGGVVEAAGGSHPSSTINSLDGSVFLVFSSVTGKVVIAPTLQGCRKN